MFTRLLVCVNYEIQAAFRFILRPNSGPNIFPFGTGPFGVNEKSQCVQKLYLSHDQRAEAGSVFRAHPNKRGPGAQVVKRRALLKTTPNGTVCSAV